MHDPAPGPRLFVNTYGPPACTPLGRRASDRYGLPPFIDGSIRREPDLEHEWPAISCLCRAGKFCPRLRVDDKVIYLTKKGRYGEGPAHWRLAAVLRVVECFDSHEEAACWYRGRSLRLPSNCMVAGNEPMPLDKSHRLARLPCVPEGKLQGRWDRAYRKRTERHPQMVACVPLFRDLSWGAPKVYAEDLEDAFGMVPATQNPGWVPTDGLDRLIHRLGRPPLPSRA